MRHIFVSFLLVTIVGGATAQEPGEEPVRKLTPPGPGAKPLELDKRIGGFYSAVSKLKNTDTRDGIGVRWNWPMELANQPWGDKGAVSLVAFPSEPVAFGKYRGFAVRLVNRGKEPVVYRACDSALFMVQEAKDDKARWREIEDPPSSRCGNSYHDIALAANGYWDFAAPAYTGAFKTKIRFRLGGSIWNGEAKWVYSNEFDGAIAKTLLRMGPTTPEVRKALDSKDAKEAGVVQTLIELISEDAKETGRSHVALLPSSTLPRSARPPRMPYRHCARSAMRKLESWWQARRSHSGTSTATPRSA